MDAQQQTVEVTAGQQVAEGAEAKPWGARMAPWLAWFLCALSMALVGATLVLSYNNDPVYFTNNVLESVLEATVLFMYATVGALIASRHASGRRQIYNVLAPVTLKRLHAQHEVIERALADDGFVV